MRSTRSGWATPSCRCCAPPRSHPNNEIRWCACPLEAMRDRHMTPLAILIKMCSLQRKQG
ncbi:hypothetical protein C6A88_31135 [Mycolicibacterium austroafricanum]|nr:hypothetical protein C6A88_31135 [Mycolicibacterium austroafricanum]